MELLAPCSAVEIFDKITILRIKKKKIKDSNKLKNVENELELLENLVADITCNSDVRNSINTLQKVNEELWVIEDDLRGLEKSKDFGNKFIDLARCVYITNDKRSAIKKRINILLGSSIIEEKSYDYL